MRYVDARMLTQVFIVAIMMGWTLRELVRIAKETLIIAFKLFELPRLQKSKKPANRLATKRISKVHF